jgi:acyl-CoA dehydrogenase
MRFFDGPDEVHLRVIARMEIEQSRAALDASAAYLTPPARE